MMSDLALSDEYQITRAKNGSLDLRPPHESNSARTAMAYSNCQIGGKGSIKPLLRISIHRSRTRSPSTLMLSTSFLTCKKVAASRPYPKVLRRQVTTCRREIRRPSSSASSRINSSRPHSELQEPWMKSIEAATRSMPSALSRRVHIPAHDPKVCEASAMVRHCGLLPAESLGCEDDRSLIQTFIKKLDALWLPSYGL